MNTVRSCFAASALLLLFRLVGLANSIFFATADVNRTTCCTTPGNVGGPGCKYGNETFHSIEIIGSSSFQSCPKPYGSGAHALQLVRKCCPLDQTYDPETLFCQAIENGQGSPDDFPRLIMEMLDRNRDNVTMVGHKYSPPAVCQDGNSMKMQIVDINAMAIWQLLSEDYNCFDVTQPPELELVALMCSWNMCINMGCINKEIKDSKHHKYCLQSYSQNGTNSKKVTVIACTSPANSSDSTESPKPQDDEKSNPSYPIPGLGNWLPLVSIILSIACLFSVFFMIPKAHDYYVFCYIACSFLFFVCLLISQWPTYLMESSLCKFFGYTTLFSILGIFCWLNVICFDCIWILRKNKLINKTSKKRNVIYNIYGWGFSSTWTYIAFMNHHSRCIGLNFYNKSYWFFEDNEGSFIFFKLPSFIMLIANLILLGLPAVDRLRMLLYEGEQTNLPTRWIELHMEKFYMSMKLFLVTGIPWSLNILSKFFGSDSFTRVIFNEIVALQGVMVFIIFAIQLEVNTRLQGKSYSIHMPIHAVEDGNLEVNINSINSFVEMESYKQKTPSYEEGYFGDVMDTEFNQIVCDTDENVERDMMPSYEEGCFGDTA